MKRYLPLFALAVLLALCADARPSWGAGGCAPGSLGGWSAAPVFLPPAAPAFLRPPAPGPEEMEAAVERVLARRADKARAAKLKAGAESECVSSCGCGRCDGECPCRSGAGRCGDGCACVVPGAGPVLISENFGLDRKRMDDGDRPKYRRFGKGGVREITADEAHRLLEKGLPDDQGKRFVTVIGPPDSLKAFSTLWATPAFAAHRDKVLLQLLPPDDWDVKRKGFVGTGSPTVYVQAPDGTVLHRQDALGDGVGLSKALLRTAPDYDPAKDPDLSKPPEPKRPDPKPDQPAPGPAAPLLPKEWKDWLLYGIVGLLAAAVFLRK
jgi:hypothetical protein